nr:glycosyltransferase family 2 protein [uncultured Pseudomonas sp.]
MDLNNADFKMGLCAIFKNEGPYILEWLAFHKAIGIDEFFIADNISTDGSSELLKNLDKLGLIKLLTFPTPDNEAPQLPAYRKLMQMYGHLVDWMAFIDADEFLIAEGGSIKKALADVVLNNSRAGAIAVNWASYGSGGKKEYEPDLVIERFKLRAKKDFGVNRHYKSIVNAKAYAGTHENPHLFRIKSEFEYISADGKPLEGDTQGIKGLSENVCWENIRLNHYIIKSYGEFLFKKNRGRATVKDNPGLDRNIGFFHGHDVNDEHESLDNELITKTRTNLAEIKSILLAAGVEKEIINIVPAKIPNVRVAIDQCVVADDSITVVGWAFVDDSNEIKYTLGLGGEDIAFDTFEKIARVDVAEHIDGAPVNCGFQLVVKREDFGAKLFEYDAFLRMHTAGYVQAVSLGTKAR